MQTEITLSESELNMDFLKRIKSFLKTRKSSKIVITIVDEENYMDSLRESVKDIDLGRNLVTFSLEEFNAYVPHQKA